MKTGDAATHRGFESHPLRQIANSGAACGRLPLLLEWNDFLKGVFRLKIAFFDSGMGGLTVARSIVDSLDAVILGATQVDVNFNVNVHTNSQGVIMGGSGGHSDAAAGAKLAMIVAPLSRARMPLIVDRVQTISTPGKSIDVILTQRGIAINPQRGDLLSKFKQAGLPVRSIQELKAIGEEINGIPQPLKTGDQVVAKVEYRDGTVIDEIRNVL